MLVGILSDSHGHPIPVQQAMALFDARGVEHIIHCGDIGGLEVFDELVGRRCTMVWGNTDVPGGGVLGYLQAAGLSAPQIGPARVTLEGKTIAVFHGHERGFDTAVANLGVDYIFHGHTHECRDDRVGKTRIINAGALHRARRKTVAMLDTATDELTFHEIRP